MGIAIEGKTVEHLSTIAEQLTQISNTLARLASREQVRFITVTRLQEFDTQPDEWRRELVGVAQIERVLTGLQFTVIRTTSGDLRVRESFDEILTMINAGAYVPPF